MYLIPFYAVEPELVERETRVIHTLVEQDGLPVGNYGLLEFYCPDPNCDCRRVMLNVAEEKRPNRFLASISYGITIWSNKRRLIPHILPLVSCKKYWRTMPSCSLCPGLLRKQSASGVMPRVPAAVRKSTSGAVGAQVGRGYIVK